MFVFLDESKQLTKRGGKFILAGLITTLRPSKIDELYKNFLEITGIKEKGGEVKSYDKRYRGKIEEFYHFLRLSKYGGRIEFVGIFAKNYKESGENYYNVLKYLLIHTLKYNKINQGHFDKINIVADNLKLDLKENKIKKLLNDDDKLKFLKKNKGFYFKFENSKNSGGIKFADFISGTLRKKYIQEKEILNREFIEYFVNEEIIFMKLKQ